MYHFCICECVHFLSSEIMTCEGNATECGHGCLATDEGPVCVCPKGSVLKEDGQACTGTNSCYIMNQYKINGIKRIHKE